MQKYIPKSVVCLREGYDRSTVLGDISAGLTVGIIALPLAMAFGIASIPDSVAADLASRLPWLTPPAMGLFTAVVAGFLISALGGSRVQIGGPTGAFIVIVYDIAARHGYEGLATATLMAGVIVILMGVAGFGAMIKFIPYPVTTGFTAGIAVIIASSQVKDFLGLSFEGGVPAEFIEKWKVFIEHWRTFDGRTVGVGLGSLAVIILLRHFAPRVPGAIVAVVLASAVVYVAGFDKSSGGTVETIGSRFGGVPRSLPTPHLPISLGLVKELLPDATTIALLCAIESLLSAVVADGMTGRRHKADCELVGQGVANIASACFWGIPATGAIARTVANIKSGGRSPLAGMIHAGTLLAFMLAAAPLAKLIPLSTLAAVLLVVAYNMSEKDHFITLFRAPVSDVIVLLTTFGLTVFTDLTIAVGVGVVLAALLFMKRMAAVSNVSSISRELADDDEDEPDPMSIALRQVPPEVEVFEINGPFFFGVADRLKDTLNQYERPPKVFILRMRRVNAIDATGLHALEEFWIKCRRQGITLILSGVHAQPLFAMVKAGLDQKIGEPNMFDNIDGALERARQLIGKTS
ncbi:MAG: STAS domain-containing protein [Phycisphaerae bacterium]|nr:MAG: STAS domain-containing protein [Planctomycetota bacterium]KAB2943844.1 MAG: STAS domain-containing protein [Phycisphaerae bacterium]MBE7455391.1 STAS domain-containing protein [Planctomycetia bacterium]MCK6465009.1 STAS domain-containing protein [Phycisphaerae bacterium]MCL4717623.1 STAS domain-containing protein [Phycisphaerae bacterium]